jgi:hypothetical protein
MSAIVDRDTTAHFDGKLPAATHELPAIDRAGREEAIADALVSRQLFRRFRPTMRREVGGSAEHRPAQVGSQAYADHVALDLFADANAGVQVVRCQVDGGIVHVDIDRNVRIGTSEVRQHSFDHQRYGDARNREAQ